MSGLITGVSDGIRTSDDQIHSLINGLFRRLPQCRLNLSQTLVYTRVNPEGPLKRLHETNTRLYQTSVYRVDYSEWNRRQSENPPRAREVRKVGTNDHPLLEAEEAPREDGLLLAHLRHPDAEAVLD